MRLDYTILGSCTTLGPCTTEVGLANGTQRVALNGWMSIVT